MAWIRLVLALVPHVLRDPPLAIALVRVGWRFRRRGWLTRFPFLPVPSRAYLEWRLHTAYGDHHAVPTAEEVARYARWAARYP